jgi:hypothetical protein
MCGAMDSVVAGLLLAGLVPLFAIESVLGTHSDVGARTVSTGEAAAQVAGELVHLMAQIGGVQTQNLCQQNVRSLRICVSITSSHFSTQ